MSPVLQLHVGTPVLHLHGQQLYYAAACLLRRGAAVKKTAGSEKDKRVPKLAPWAKSLPIFGPLLNLSVVCAIMGSVVVRVFPLISVIFQ